MTGRDQRRIDLVLPVLMTKSSVNGIRLAPSVTTVTSIEPTL